MRKIPFIIGQYYHIFNRGTDKREVFSDKQDALRFLYSIEVFNTIEPVGSLRELERELGKNFIKRRCPTPADKKLVNIICYCLNPNHFHFVLEEVTEGGISEFMKRLGGYTLYYNERYKRSGVLFQGRFKAVHIDTNEQLLHVSAYVNLNNKVHKKFDGTKKHFLDLIPNRSSWNEYTKIDKNIFPKCKKDIMLGQFKDKKDYKKFAEETVKGIKEKRYEN